MKKPRKDTRSNLVNFRLSDDELSLLIKALEGSTARTVSDFCRQVVMRAAQADGDAVLVKIEKLELRLQRLEDTILPDQAPLAS